MKKAPKIKGDAEMLDDYDFSRGVRGKYAKRYGEGTNVVLLAPDVAAAFPDSASVNEALRMLVKIASKSDLAPANYRTVHPKLRRRQCSNLMDRLDRPATSI